MLKHLFPKKTRSSPADAPFVAGALPRLMATELLAEYISLTNKIEELAGLPREFYVRYYESALQNYAVFVQQLPASETHHHANRGGMLQHGLEVAMNSMQLRRGYLLPQGASPEEIARKQDLWTYAVFTAALCHYIGKPAVDQAITVYDSEGKACQWVPWFGPMPNSVRCYQVKFRRDRLHRFHERASLLLIGQIMLKKGLGWLSGDLPLFSQWLACIGGDIDEAGAIGEIVGQADRESVARNLGAEPNRSIGTSDAKPLHEKLLTDLRHLFAEGNFPLNRNGAAGWLVDDDLWLVSKRAIDELRAHLLVEGHSGIPNRNDRIFDELQQRGILIPCNDRAIWRAKVKGEDWEHELPLIRLPAGKIWVDPETRPASFTGEVNPISPAPEKANETLAPEFDIESAEFGIDERNSLGGGSYSDERNLLPDDDRVEFSDPASNGNTAHTKPAVAQTASAQADNPGSRFWEWIRQNIQNGILPVDAPKARIHTIPEGMFLVSPAIFKEFVEKTGAESSWEQVQKRFLKLNVHIKTPDDFNVHTR